MIFSGVGAFVLILCLLSMAAEGFLLTTSRFSSNKKTLYPAFRLRQPGLSSVTADRETLPMKVGGDESESMIKEEEEAKSRGGGTEIMWTAEVSSSCRVKESKRTVEQYMALPASQYSVLSSDQIVRLSDDQFRCDLPAMNFFGTLIQPILYVDVKVFPDDAKAEIIVSRAETVGSDIARKVNGTFSISAINTVTAGVDNKGRKTLNSSTKLKIDVAVPPESKLPKRILQSGGNFIMQSSLNVIVPTFVRILRYDFERWSAGDDSRSAVEGAKLS